MHNNSIPVNVKPGYNQYNQMNNGLNKVPANINQNAKPVKYVNEPKPGSFRTIPKVSRPLTSKRDSL